MKWRSESRAQQITKAVRGEHWVKAGEKGMCLLDYYIVMMLLWFRPRVQSQRRELRWRGQIILKTETWYRGIRRGGTPGVIRGISEQHRSLSPLFTPSNLWRVFPLQESPGSLFVPLNNLCVSHKSFIFFGGGVLTLPFGHFKLDPSHLWPGWKSPPLHRVLC